MQSIFPRRLNVHTCLGQGPSFAGEKKFCPSGFNWLYPVKYLCLHCVFQWHVFIFLYSVTYICAYFSLQGWINGYGEISLPSSFDNCFFNSFASPVSGTRCSECVSRVFHRNVSTSGPTSTAIRQRVTSPRRILYSI